MCFGVPYVLRALIKPEKHMDNSLQILDSSKKRNNRKYLWLNALIGTLKKKSEPAVATFEGGVHFNMSYHKIFWGLTSHKTTQKLS